MSLPGLCSNASVISLTFTGCSVTQAVIQMEISLVCLPWGKEEGVIHYLCGILRVRKVVGRCKVSKSSVTHFIWQIEDALQWDGL